MGAEGGNLIIGAGSTLNITGAMNIGVAGAGVLDIQGGTITATGGAASLHFSTFGRLVQVGGRIDPFPTADATGGQFSGGTDEFYQAVYNEGAAATEPLVQDGAQTFITPLVSVAPPPNTKTRGTWDVHSDGTLVLDTNTVTASQTIFFGDTTGALVIGQQVSVSGSNVATIAAAAVAGFQASIDDYEAGNQITVDTTAAATFSYVNGGSVIAVTDISNGATEGTIAFTSSGAAAQAFADRNNATPSLVDQVISCFAAGTRLATPSGPIAVEDLAVGGAVTTVLGGSGRIGWIGQRSVDCARHIDPEAVWPVRIARGAFGENIPLRDLYLSPEHAVFVDGVLIPVRWLINGSAVVQVRRARVTYYHVELPEHDVILAEDLPVESYLDAANRANFADQVVVRLFPDFAPEPAARAWLEWEANGAAPLVMAGPMLSDARAVLAANIVARTATSR